MMRRYKGFTFVELMMVLLVLGVIIMLTMPLLKNLKDDSKIYRAYMKKANQDVTDAVSMALIKNRLFTGFDKLGKLSNIGGAADYNDDSDDTTVASSGKGSGIRTALQVAVNGTECKGDECLTDDPFGGNLSGLKLPGKSVMMFEYKYEAATSAKEATYGYIYIDMNGNKSPNELCKDRYKFELYNDRAVMIGCDLSL